MPLVVILSLLGFLQQVEANCTLCINDTPFNPDGTIGATPCSMFGPIIAETDATDPTCTDFQLQSYRHCSCESYPTDVFCSMCPDGVFDIPNKNKQIPELGMTCDEALFAKKADASNICEEIPKYAYFCGCSGIGEAPTLSPTPLPPTTTGVQASAETATSTSSGTTTSATSGISSVGLDLAIAVTLTALVCSIH